jgi:hypothetical protein
MYMEFQQQMRNTNIRRGKFIVLGLVQEERHNKKYCRMLT